MRNYDNGSFEIWVSMLVHIFFWYYFQLLAHCAVSSTRGELAKINEVDEEELELKYSESVTESSISGHGRTRCRYSVSGCPFKLPSMQQHEDRECSYRPTRCPSLTCTAKAPFVKLLKHITVIIIQTKKISIIVYIRTYSKLFTYFGIHLLIIGGT